MGRNVEIKARARDFEAQARVAEALVGGCVEHLVQEDTFFNVPEGRLKLRVFEDGSGELIQYDRPDSNEPRESRYVCFPTNDPASLKQLLANALGVRGVVRKKRTLSLAGQTRIHLDEVEGLGRFIEIEVALKPGEAFEDGAGVAGELMARLGIEKSDLVPAAYVDLLSEKQEV